MRFGAAAPRLVHGIDRKRRAMRHQSAARLSASRDDQLVPEFRRILREPLAPSVRDGPRSPWRRRSQPVPAPVRRSRRSLPRSSRQLADRGDRSSEAKGVEHGKERDVRIVRERIAQRQRAMAVSSVTSRSDNGLMPSSSSGLRPHPGRFSPPTVMTVHRRAAAGSSPAVPPSSAPGTGGSSSGRT